MSFLYRFAVAVTRRQPYLDWANRLGDAVELTVEMSDENRTIYLVPEATAEPDRSEILDEYWEAMFENELSAWSPATDRWPRDRTREMFDEWFDAEVTGTVCDLAPEEPMTQDEVDAIDLEQAVTRCAWCEADLEEGADRIVGFKLASRDRFAALEGRVLPLAIGEDEDRVVLGIVAAEDSDAARRGDDILFRACTARCERALRSAVPKALKRLFRR